MTHETSKPTNTTASDRISRIVGENLQQIRMARKLSLDDVAEMTGVSKSMLSEIERGIKTPTIAVLYRICEGIHVSFNMLLKMPTPKVEMSKEPIYKDFGGMDVWVMFEHDPNNPLDLQHVYLPPHSSHAANSHGDDNTWEYVLVTEGEFTLILEDKTYVLPAGSSLRFLANCYHEYVNNTDKDVRLYNITLFNDR